MRTLLMSALAVFMVLGPMPSEAKGRMFKHFKKEMNLSEEQMKEIKSIKDKYKPQLKEFSSKACDLRQSLHKELGSQAKGEEFKKNMVERYNQYRIAQNEHKLLRFKMALEIREILNPDQVSKFNKLHRKESKMDKFRCGSDDNE